MKMYFDKFSQIGSSHCENEDFAVIGDENNPFIIVCDGCSSSENTSTGSRIIALCAAEILRCYPWGKIEDVGKHAILKADYVISSLGGASKVSLDSTLIIAMVRSDTVEVCMWGDGSVYGKNGNERLNTSIEYSNEMPFYLSYGIDRERLAHYKSLVDSGEIKKTSNDSLWGKSEEVTMEPWQTSYDLNSLEYLLISTDGVESFISKDNEPIQQRLIDKDVTVFKRTNGEFIGRRMKRMMKEHKKIGINHYDDLTIAGISFEK